jgi:threonine/homoserine/homoserine lactone efflux protein
MHTDLLGSVAVIAVLVITPGPDTAITVRGAVSGGRRAGWATAGGVLVGQAVWTMAASVGLAALVVASEPVFHALQWLGAGYLVFLGGESLLAAFRRSDPDPVRELRRTRRPVADAFRRGLLSNLANPKMALLFMSLLPQFGATDLATMLAYGCLLCGLTFVWLGAYATLVARLGDLLRRPPIRRSLDALTGLSLVGLGTWRLAGD